MAKTNYDSLAATKMPLKAKRFFRNITQAQLSNLSGVHQSRISAAENGLTTLSEGEKMKIVSVLSGYVDWHATENQNDGYGSDGYQMDAKRKYDGDPEEAYNKWLKKEHGLKIVRDDEMAMPRIVPADQED